MIKLTKGTKEIVPVDVSDLNSIVTDLAGTNPKYDFIDASSTFIYNQQAATSSGTTIYCLINASASGPSGLLVNGTYRLFVSFTAGTETPRLGPIAVLISDEIVSI